MLKIEVPANDLLAINELGRALVRIADAKREERLVWFSTDDAPCEGDPEGTDNGDAQETVQQPFDEIKTDTNTVPFNADFCSGSLTADGTWRRRRGVSKQDFDAWYSGAKTLPLPQLMQEPGLHEVDTQAAFAPPQPAPLTFKNPGEFMGWVAEQQAAGHITQADVQAAYTQLGVGLPDIFGDDAATHINNLHGILSAKVPA